MKKNLIFCAIYLLFTTSCEKNVIFNEYKDINRVWKFKSYNYNNNIIKLPYQLDYIDLSKCKIKRKHVTKAGMGCTGWINDLNKNGLTFGYFLATEKQITLKNFFDISQLNGNVGITKLELNAEQLFLKSVLEGEWEYQIIEKQMIWQNMQGEKQIIFEEN